MAIAMNRHLYDSNFWKALTAVASGIMTNLLYDLVPQTSYAIEWDGVHYMIVPNGDNAYSTTVTIIIVFFLFFSLWGIFSLIIYIGAKISRQIKFRKIKRIDGRSLLEVFNNAKDQTVRLIDTLEKEKKLISSSNSARLHIRELVIIITSLHVHFCKKKYITNHFRHLRHASIIKISEGISEYEFFALLNLLDELVHSLSCYARDDELMLQDCKEMISLLADMPNNQYLTLQNFI